MTRSEHLAFCGICQKRSFDNMKGIICGLTKEYATFEENCPDFEVDNLRKSELERETEANLLEAAEKKSAKRHKTSNILKEFAHLNPVSEYRNSKGLHRFWIGIGSFVTISFIIALFQDTEGELISNPLSYLFPLLGIWLVIMSIKSVRDRSTKLVINEDGISDQKTEIKWIQVIDSQLAHVPMQKSNDSYFLQLCIHPSAKLIEFDVTGLDNTPAHIGATFEFYLQQARNKYGA